MLRKTPIKTIGLQSPDEKVYILKLIAHQKLGAKWIYYRKIKRGDQGLAIFKEKSLMEQMKATRAALKFTTKSARKLYRLAYQDSLKDIRAYTGLKTEFPELQDPGDSDEVMPLNSEQDAVIISWTPIKFVLPVMQLRAKGAATQRHTEGLAAKLFFKVAGYYSDPSNWDRYKLNLYLRRITKTSSYQEIVSELEPLKSDLEKFIETYEPFKFGKASLSKDVAQDRDAFDDAMGVDSFESQLNTLYWYHFIYIAIEQFIFKYYLSLVISTVSKDAIRYLTTIFEPVLQKVIEIRNVFLGSFETDRTKRAFRVPYQKLIKKLEQEPIAKNIKTQMGAFECYTYNLPLLEKTNLNYELESVPAAESEWETFAKHYLLNIDRPPVVDQEENNQTAETPKPEPESNFEEEKKILTAEKETLFKTKKELDSKKQALKQKTADMESLSKEEKIELEEERATILSQELELDKKIQKLKEKFSLLEEKQKGQQMAESSQKAREAKFADPAEILRFENELSQLPIRQFVLMNIMTTMISCTQFKRQARYMILERFKERVKNDQELENKRIEEIRKKAEKKLRELKKRKGKMDRLKQDGTANVIADDINKYEKGIEDRIEIIKKDSIQQMRQQKQRLNLLFDEISKEKTVDLGATPRCVWRLLARIDKEKEFIKEFPVFVSTNIQSNYYRELEPFYKNLFSILDLSVKEKILMIQSLEKCGIETSIKLTLDDEEEREFEEKIEQMKNAILEQTPDLFICKILFFNKLIPVKDVFNLSLDNKSLNTLLLLKIASPKATQSFNLKGEAIKSLIEMNSMINPLPKYSIVQSGKEKEKQPEKRINVAILNSLLAKLEA